MTEIFRFCLGRRQLQVKVAQCKSTKCHKIYLLAGLISGPDKCNNVTLGPILAPLSNVASFRGRASLKVELKFEAFWSIFGSHATGLVRGDSFPVRQAS